MSLFLHPRRGVTSAIGVCDRCKSKTYLDQLRPDGDKLGLRVCPRCWDPIDRYKLPPRQVENITLPFVRPPTSMVVDYLLDQNGNPVMTETDIGIEAE